MPGSIEIICVTFSPEIKIYISTQRKTLVPSESVCGPIRIRRILGIGEEIIREIRISVQNTAELQANQKAVSYDDSAFLVG